MKKTLKYTVITFVFLVLVLSFSSCKELDKTRESTGNWGDEKRSFLVLNGEKYLYLGNMNEEFFAPEGRKSDFLIDSKVTIAEKDMPLLVAQLEGENFFFSGKNNEVITDGFSVYCKENEKEKILNEFENPVFETYTYSIFKDNDTKTVELSEEEKNAIKEIKVSGKITDEKTLAEVYASMGMDYSEFYKGEIPQTNYASSYSFRNTTADLVFYDTVDYTEFISLDENKSYFLLDVASHIDNYGNYLYEDVTVYKVDEKYTKTVTDLIEKAFYY